MEFRLVPSQSLGQRPVHHRQEVQVLRLGLERVWVIDHVAHQAAHARYGPHAAPRATPPDVAASHAKSPCRSPLVASATRSISPRARSASGGAPSSDGRGVVSQNHAA